MIVPFLDLRAAYLELKEEIDAALAATVDGGWYVGGEPVTRFEAGYAKFSEAAHCVGVASGLDALVLALMALEVGPGDEVIVPSHTFIATWLAVSRVGASIVPVEPDPVTLNIDPAKIEQAITARTKVIVPVHLYGRPADLDPIISLARGHGLRVVEDAAQAHGARYRGKRIGAHGDLVCWSFYPGKNLGAMGDGGAITTDDAALASRVRELGNYGTISKYNHARKGLNSRLDSIQAAILTIKLCHLDRWNQRRVVVAECYRAAFKDLDLELPVVDRHSAGSVWHLFVIQVGRRQALQAELSRAGVSTLVHYPCAPHRQDAYADLGWNAGRFPIAEQLADSVISLPIGPHLEMSQVQYVADAVVRAFRTRNR